MSERNDSDLLSDRLEAAERILSYTSNELSGVAESLKEIAGDE